MFVRNEECFYYLTVYNESYDMPAMPGEQVRDGIISGLYPFKTVKPDGAKLEVQLLGSGVILNEALRAQQILAEKYDVASTVYSATSYQMLRRDAIECERHNRLHPDADEKVPYVQQVLGDTKGPVIATSDYMRALPEQVAPVPRRPAAGPRHRRLRPQRDAQEPAAVLRGGRRARGGRGAVRAGRARRTRPRPW